MNMPDVDSSRIPTRCSSGLGELFGLNVLKLGALKLGTGPSQSRERDRDKDRQTETKTETARLIFASIDVADIVHVFPLEGIQTPSIEMSQDRKELPRLRRNTIEPCRGVVSVSIIAGTRAHHIHFTAIDVFRAKEIVGTVLQSCTWLLCYTDL